MALILAFGDRTVVAGVAAAKHFVVVHIDIGEAGGAAMAVFADIGGSTMLGPLAGRLGAIVAGEAVGRSGRVGESRRQPGGGLVAIAAFRSGGDVRYGLAIRNRVVVAA